MKQKKEIISKKMALLNETIFVSITKKDDSVIIKNFTENAIKILEADFGFAWWKFSDDDSYKLAYKSPATPYDVFLPRAKSSHYQALKRKKPFFASNLQKKDYESSDITPYMKSFVIIPIYHEKTTYGTITLCYKKKHIFSEEEIILSEIIGRTTAQSITIHRLIKTDALLREERLKTEFIANATHEFRTPLAVIKGNIDLARRGTGKNPKSAMSAFRAINYEVKHLSSILSDLTLITSKTWELNNKFEFGNLDIKSLIEVVVRRCKTLARKKNISIIASKIPSLILKGDKLSLEKMLMNLVKNSIIYGNMNGHTIIEVHVTRNILTISVADDGIGIPKEYLTQLFERFYRVNKHHNPGGNSTGLGLSIVKSIAEQHGGRVSVRSTPNKGSVFSVVLPIRR